MLKCDIMKIMENELRGKRVMSNEGLMLGTLMNATVNEQTGKLEHIMVEPSNNIDPRLYHRDEKGHILFPFDSVKSVKDVVIITEE
jgi:sporulation protein YlmC with PRC-barrel domain